MFIFALKKDQEFLTSVFSINLYSCHKGLLTKLNFQNKLVRQLRNEKQGFQIHYIHRNMNRVYKASVRYYVFVKEKH